MKMSLQKGRRDFGRRLLGYAVDGGALVKCPDHPGSVYQGSDNREPAHEVVIAVWQSGKISSDLEGAVEQMDRIIENAPKSCSHTDCWLKD